MLERPGAKVALSSKLTSRLWQVGLLMVGLSLGCGGASTRHDADAASGSSTGGTASDRTPTGGASADAGAAPTEPTGGEQTVAGAPTGGAGTGGSGGMAAAGAAGGGGQGGALAATDRCAEPGQLEFVDGEATVSDDTSRATDEFPTLSCAGAQGQAFSGGQLYYRFTARPGREYALRLKAPGFSTAEFYVFPAAAPCTVDAIRAACSSGGVTGTRSASTPRTPLTYFAPREPGDYIIGVDTSYPMGTKFTLTVFEYCGTSGGTDCKVNGCDLHHGQVCIGNTVSGCNDDGTATATTDCALTGKSCEAGACVASVVDGVGNSGWMTSPAMTAGKAGGTLLDFYEVTTSRTITNVKIYMVQPKQFPLDWLILESAERAGPYQTIFTTRTMSAGAMTTSDENTGPIQVPIIAGRFYAIGVALPADARYYLEQRVERTFPLDVFFGQVTSAAVVPSASSSATIGYSAPDDFVIAQWITTKL